MRSTAVLYDFAGNDTFDRKHQSGKTLRIASLLKIYSPYYGINHVFRFIYPN